MKRIPLTPSVIGIVFAYALLYVWQPGEIRALNIVTDLLTALLALLVKRLRQGWPSVRIILRADSGFCRWRMLRWCDARHTQTPGIGVPHTGHFPRVTGAPALLNVACGSDISRLALHFMQ